MRRLSIAALVVTALCSAPAAAQLEPRPVREMRAFEPAWVAGIGLLRPSDRAEGSNIQYGYTSSVSIEFGAEMPLSRRSGVIFSGVLAPLAKIRRQDPIAVLVTESSPIYVGEITLGWRIKPWAPAFVAVGAGYTHATETPVVDDEGGMGAAHGVVALGFDAKLRDRYALRVRAAVRKVMAASLDDPTIEALSPLDFTFSLSVRARKRSFR